MERYISIQVIMLHLATYFLVTPLGPLAVCSYEHVPSYAKYRRHWG